MTPDRLIVEVRKVIDELNTLKSYILEDGRRLDAVEQKNESFLNKLAEFSMKINSILSECRVAFKNKNEKPYKCPLCEGEGVNKAINVYNLGNCKACDGKGVLWR